MLNALRQVPGVACVRVDVAGGLATVRGSARTESLSAAVEQAGFSIRNTSVTNDDGIGGGVPVTHDVPAASASAAAPSTKTTSSKSDTSLPASIPTQGVELGNLADNRCHSHLALKNTSTT